MKGWEGAWHRQVAQLPSKALGMGDTPKLTASTRQLCCLCGEGCRSNGLCHRPCLGLFPRESKLLDPTRLHTCPTRTPGWCHYDPPACPTATPRHSQHLAAGCPMASVGSRALLPATPVTHCGLRCLPAHSSPTPVLLHAVGTTLSPALSSVPPQPSLCALSTRRMHRAHWRCWRETA